MCPARCHGACLDISAITAPAISKPLLPSAPLWTLQVQQQQAEGAQPAAVVHALVGAIAAHMPDVVVMDDVQSEMVGH